MSCHTSSEVVVGIYGSHNSSVCLSIDGKIKEVVEIERFISQKNASLFVYHPTVVKNPEIILGYIYEYFKNLYGVEKYDFCYYDAVDLETVSALFPADNYIQTYHHVNHSCSSLYQSPHPEALVLSFDGGGNDGWFVIFNHKRGEDPVVLANEPVNYGVCYSMIAHYITEVKHETDYAMGNLVYGGKIMGLAAYGRVREEWMGEFNKWYDLPTGLPHEDLAKEMLIRLGIKLDENGLANSEDSKDLAATNQRALEENVLKKLRPFLEREDYAHLPLHITGGGGLNILLNTRLSELREIFVSPNPSDCGLAAGMVCSHIKSKSPIDLTYSGPEIFDKGNLPNLSKGYHCYVNINILIQELKECKIVGVARGRCEHGPRALGNRSILCNPSCPNSKDILNSKVKNREWYRPFAPVVRLEDVNEYFEWSKESRWMNFCPTVKEEYKEKLSAVTHEDGTARVQTVTREQNKWLYDLLTKFKKATGLGVLLNTSFNVDKKPILNTYNEAFEVFSNSEMDGLMLEDLYISKTPVEIKDTVEIKGTVEIDKKPVQNLTIVSGLWNINKEGRSFDQYKDAFNDFLKIPQKMILFIPKELEEFVWDRRSKDNTSVVIFELEDIKNLFDPFWDDVQSIREDPNWYNSTGEGGWLSSSPQAINQWYNPIVMSKYSLLNTACCYNNFNTDYFLWVDAGLSSTVNHVLMDERDVFSKIEKYLNPFLFLSYPYETSTEIHGFKIESMNNIAKDSVSYVCRGGLFGGHKDFITRGNEVYWHLLKNTLSAGYMGTEESIFTLMAYLDPHIYRRYSLDGNGLVTKFLQELDSNGEVSLEEVPNNRKAPKPVFSDISHVKTNLYFLTFNYPDQLEYTIASLSEHNGFMDGPHQKVIIDNSTNEQARIDNKKICDKYGFEHIIQEKNSGICGGRQRVAEHFHDSDSDFYLFFEDDMTLSASGDTSYCRNGFRKYIPDLYLKVHQIMMKEDFDFLKLNFTEVYMDNNIQTSWYNVPQDIRDSEWPEYSTLPTHGIDPHSPRTRLNNIERISDGLCYLTGEIYYCNWPMIVSKKGNKKMFIDIKWAHSFEGTWMSNVFQETKKGNIASAVLLASPVTHERFKHYKPEERIEGSLANPDLKKIKDL